jgi:hypothetical protein
LTKNDQAIAYIQRLLYWDWEAEKWDWDRATLWNGFDELSDIDSIMSDLGLVPSEDDPPPPEFPEVD